MKMPFKPQGFTLIELLITVALAAIVLALGVPNFQELMRNNRLTSMTNDFISALHIARSEAIKRGSAVTVCKSSDGAACSAAAAGYEVGWITFVDTDSDGVRDAGEELLNRSYPLSTGYTLRGSAANAIDAFIAYRPNGRSTATGSGTFVLCQDGDTSKSRTIAIEFTGRTHVDKTAPASCS